jgi:hypothetical protein
MAVRRIGYWKASLNDAYPFPQEVEVQLDSRVRSQVVGYLDNGVRVQAYRGFSYCRYGCGPNGSTELSDGIWTWPDGLVHYVREHGVGLPPAFVAHACRPNAASTLTVPADSAERDFDESIWIEWAKRYRRPIVDALLAAARARATLRCDDILQARAEQFEKARGLADAVCLSAGCTRLAVVGLVFCGRCMTAQDHGFTIASAEAAELSGVLARAPWNEDA